MNRLENEEVVFVDTLEEAENEVYLNRVLEQMSNIIYNHGYVVVSSRD